MLLKLDAFSHYPFTIMPGAMVDDSAIIGERTFIGYNVVIEASGGKYPQTVIGRHVCIQYDEQEVGMKSMGYVCTDGHWAKDCKPVARFTWREVIKEALAFITIAVVTCALAFLFVEALEREEFIHQAKQAKRYEELNYQGRHLPTWGADGPAYSTGHQYWVNRKEMNR